MDKRASIANLVADILLRLKPYRSDLTASKYHPSVGNVNHDEDIIHATDIYKCKVRKRQNRKEYEFCTVMAVLSAFGQR